MPNLVIYEHPVNERVRTLLRLEHLFHQCRHFLHADDPWDSRMLLDGLFDLLAIFSRGDLKGELIKELERASNNLAPLLDNPAVDRDKLSNLLRITENLSRALHELNGQLGQKLREDPFLTPIRQRKSIPGGSCDFDLPLYHRWLALPAEIRRADQQRWFARLDHVRQPVELLLKLIRNSAELQLRQAQEGIYQQPLETDTPYQMIRIALPASSDYHAEVSGGRHRFNVRFLKQVDGRSQVAEGSVDFQLACCSL